ncbi:MAG: serine hydrolase domain-containing protein [Pirellulaceae bacterium]|nr:beta-lactamase family protein [Planctomycetales bacterium]MCA9220391.1 beta-lactamase family protein [Planctomycetales bacterium]
MATRIDPEKLEPAWQVLRRWIERRTVPAVSAVVGNSEQRLAFHGGWQRVDESKPLVQDAIFLIASPTKPLTALAIMMLVETGEVLPSDPVSRYLPDFAANGKSDVTIAHCLTHTSGLPDMVPENQELRRRQAPLTEFLEAVYRLELDFAPGTRVQYQSMGSLVLAEIIHQVFGMQLRDFLRVQIFQPLKMHDTSLGMSPFWESTFRGELHTRRSRIAEVNTTGLDQGDDWGWNSDYWLKLGVPWGGLLASADDWGKLCQHLLRVHVGEHGVVNPATLAAMTTNQLETMPEVPEADRRCQPWGYGWRLNSRNQADSFGDLLSPRAYGHWGATGTMVWIDPARDLFCVALTTQPYSGRRRPHAELSNIICSEIV